MHYLIIAIIVIALAIFLLKHILFNPRLNSVLNIIGFAALIVLSWNTVYSSAIIIFVIAIIDCIRDIVLAEDIYEDVDIAIDPLYAIKSILSPFDWFIAACHNGLLDYVPIKSRSFKSLL